jgi:hypothetical protein
MHEAMARAYIKVVISFFIIHGMAGAVKVRNANAFVHRGKHLFLEQGKTLAKRYVRGIDW